ncbi:MAG TPA: hypothetical protein EYQ14_25830 [Gammaproteobacteria bacterium]|nr:hypothetical protein [Gammaproteobacteria bacterium]
MLEMAIVGMIAAVALLIMLMKLDFWKVLGFDLYVDIAATGLLMVLFAGTLGGMIAAMVGGLQISIVLLVVKKVFGYMKPVRIKRDGFMFKCEWKTIPGFLYNKHMGAKGYYSKSAPAPKKKDEGLRMPFFGYEEEPVRSFFKGW